MSCTSVQVHRRTADLQLAVHDSVNIKQVVNKPNFQVDVTAEDPKQFPSTVAKPWLGLQSSKR